MPLIDTGLVVRYYIDEAADGTTPTEVADSSGNGSNLTIDYGSGNMDYTEVSGNRGLESISTTGTQKAKFAIPNTSGAIRDDLHGVQKATIEVVVDIDTINSNGSRICTIATVSSAVFSLDATSATNWRMSVRMSDSSQDQYTFNGGSGARAVFHVVLDSTEAAGDRIRVYKDGSEIAASVNPEVLQDGTISLPDNIGLAILGHPIGTGERSFVGTHYYAAIYAHAFTASEVTNNYDILTLDDDTPAAGGVTINEEASVTDSLSSTRIVSRKVLSSVSCEDSLSALRLRKSSAVDNVEVTDSSIEDRLRNRGSTDEIAVTDSLSAVSSGVKSVTIGEEISVTDSLSPTRLAVRRALSSILCEDSPKVSRLRESITVDSAEVADSYLESRLWNRSLTDETAVTDSLSAFSSGIKSVTISEETPVTDSLNSIRLIVRQALSSVLCEDSSSAVRLRKSRALDNVEILDTYLESRVRTRDLDDDVALTDSIDTLDYDVSSVVISDWFLVADSVTPEKIFGYSEFSINYGIEELSVKYGAEELYVVYGSTSEVSQ